MRPGAWGVALLCLALAPGARAGLVEYLYIEANVGGSAGGHVALHFPETGDVFDSQNDELDNLRLRRLAYPHFRYLYSVRANRTIHAARVEVPGGAHDALLARFQRALLVQDKLYRVLQALRDDLALARRLSDGDAERARGDPGPALRLPGSGFFYGGTEPEPGETSAALAALRSRVAARHGEAYLAKRIADLGRTVRALDPAALPPLPAPLSKRELPRSGYGPSERFLDLSLQLLALRALAQARPLDPGARRSGAAGFALDRGERERVRRFADALEARLAELPASRRPDWGFALLLGMARLEVLRESAASGRLVLLDAIPERAAPLTPRDVARSRPYLREMADWSRARFLEQRSAFFAGPRPGEPDLARLEAAASRYLEIEQGLASGAPLRLHAGELVPDRAAGGVRVPLPLASAGVLREARARSRERLRAYQAALHDLLGYHLLYHSCVTEIAAMLGDDAPGLLGVIPFVSHARFVEAKRPVVTGRVPAYRRERLAEMYARENDLWVHLREANTFTSTVYRRNGEDSFFVFFTDDAPLLRPLYGAVNLAAGMGELAFGLLAAPFDGGRRLWSGAKGALFSLPELAFVNVRKGRLDYAPGDPPRTALRPDPGPAEQGATP